MLNQRFAFPWLVGSHIVLLLIAIPALAAPQINSVSQQGVKIGEPTVLLFEGGDLAGEPRIVSSLVLKSQQVRPDATANRVGFEVVVDEATQPGVYALRIATA